MSFLIISIQMKDAKGASFANQYTPMAFGGSLVVIIRRIAESGWQKLRIVQK